MITFKIIGENKMQLDEQIQHHIDLLPLELKAEVLDFVLFLSQKRERQAKERIDNLMAIIPEEVNSVGVLKDTISYTMQEDNTDELLQIIRNIKPVPCKYSSEEIVRSLRDGSLLA
jgi:Protein of unknown function (DUF2281)